MRTEVFYLSYEKTDDVKISQIMLGHYLPSKEEIDNNYVSVCTFDSESSNEELFELFNSDDNPLTNESCQDFLCKHKLHTSMSVGDMIRRDDDYYVVAGIGFQKLNVT